MKKRSMFQTTLTVLFLALFSLTACKKENIEVSEPQSSTEQVTNNWSLEGDAGSATSRSECLQGNVILTSQAEVDNFAQLYSNCSIITGDLKIQEGVNEVISSLEPLEFLLEIAGDLDVDGTGTLPNLIGLHNITEIGGSFEITNNANLTSIMSDDEMEIEDGCFIGGTLEITNNPNLTSLVGGAGDLPIFMPNDVRIIDNPSLTSLQGLHEVEEIGGDLIIDNNDALVDLSDLESLQSIGGSFEITNNANLTSIMSDDEREVEDGCQIGGTLEIANNPNLTSLMGGGDTMGIFMPNDVRIINNPSLVSLAGLHDVETIGGDLIIDNNDALVDLSDLESLQSIGGNLEILNNASISSIIVDNLGPSFLNGTLSIVNNPQLSVCAIEDICSFFDDGGQATISNNPQGCNSVNQVKAECAANMDCGTFAPRTWGNNILSHKAKINWNLVNDADHYKVRYRKKNSNNPWKIKQSTSASKILYNLLQNTNFEYQHKYHCTNDWSSWGNLKFFKTKP